MELAAPPAWLLEVLVAGSRRNGHAPAVEGAIPEGNRNATLTSWAGSMRRPGMGEGAILAALLHENSARCDPPLDDAEVSKIAASVARYAPEAEPLHVSPPSLAPAPAFPSDVLPPIARSYVSGAAEALGTPPELVAVPLLAYAGATIGDGLRIELKPGYCQRAILYVAVVAPPGSAKSPAQDAARYPLDVLQREAIETYKDELKNYERELDEWQSAPKETRGEKPERPVLEHFFTTDATLEALAAMLEGSAGVVLSRDEIVGWVKACDAYRGGRGGDRQQWLSLWAGSPLKVDRKKGEPIFVPFPTVCVAGGVQPELLTELADEAGRRDGFIERILWSYPEIRAVGWTEQTISARSQQAILDLFRKLRRPSGEAVRLSADARVEWVRWYDENSRLTAEASGVAQGIYAKLPNQAARLALILHCLTRPGSPTARPLDRETMLGAIELAEYFRAHALRVLPGFGAISPARSAGLLGRIERLLGAAGGEWLSRETINRKLGGHVPSDKLRAALEQLRESDVAERQELPTGGRPQEQWRISLAEKRRNAESQPGDPNAPPTGDLSPFLRFSAPEQNGAQGQAKALTCVDCSAELPPGSKYRCPPCVEAEQRRFNVEYRE